MWSCNGSTGTAARPRGAGYVMPIWDWPVWHPHWRAAQLRALSDLSGINPAGQLEDSLRKDCNCPAPTRHRWNPGPSSSWAN